MASFSPSIYEWDIDTGAVLDRRCMRGSILGTFVDAAIAPSSRGVAVASIEAQFASPPKTWNILRVFDTKPSTESSP